MAKRYNGTHRDPARANQRLPAVHIWATWNEPNHSAFLLPQWRRYQGQWMPRSPHLYRELHQRGYAAIKRVDPTNQVLIGNTAALGGLARGPRRTVAPLRFIRELACVDRRGRPLEDRPECADFKPLVADGFAHHPYSLYDSPDVPSVHPEQVTMGDLDRLSRLLDQLYRLGRTTTRFPILITEYGYETNPPDQLRGVSLRRQARYHGLATYLAWRQQDVTSFAQFLMNDIAPPAGAGNDPYENARNWQSGLYFHDGRAKDLAVQAFRTPFWAEVRNLAGQNAVVLFGQVRPSEGRKRMEIQVKAPDGTWIPIQTYETRSAGDIDVRPEHDVLPDRHGGLLPARRALRRAGDLPRPLDQVRRDLRVRDHDPGARAAAYGWLTTTFIRILRGWFSQRIRQVPTRPNLCVNLPFDLELGGGRDVVAVGLLDRDVVKVRSLPNPGDLVALVDLDAVRLEEVVLDLDLDGRGVGDGDEGKGYCE